MQNFVRCNKHCCFYSPWTFRLKTIWVFIFVKEAQTWAFLALYSFEDWILTTVVAVLNNITCFSRKDPHGFFSFPVTDAIAPGYSTIIKHPMDFSTMKDKIINNEYNTVTEFKVRINAKTKLGWEYLFLLRVLQRLCELSFPSFTGTPFDLQADFKLMCDNAMVYNRPETVYYKAAKKLLHTGFKMMSKVMMSRGMKVVNNFLYYVFFW